MVVVKRRYELDFGCNWRIYSIFIWSCPYTSIIGTSIESTPPMEEYLLLWRYCGDLSSKVLVLISMIL